MLGPRLISSEATNPQIEFDPWLCLAGEISFAGGFRRIAPKVPGAAPGLDQSIYAWLALDRGLGVIHPANQGYLKVSKESRRSWVY